jgi:signal recognition particle receptor subunit beta
VDSLNRGRLMALETKDDRTLFFDLLPIFFRTSALSFRVKVYTVPGQPMHEATRRVVLRQADGVVFVADSQRDEAAANKAAYGNLLENIERLGLERAKLPVVVQYNKRDLPNIVPDGELAGFEPGQRVFPASAMRGDGVMETFFGLIAETWDSIDTNVGLAAQFKLGRDAFMAAVREHTGGARRDAELKTDD